MIVHSVIGTLDQHLALWSEDHVYSTTTTASNVYFNCKVAASESQLHYLLVLSTYLDLVRMERASPRTPTTITANITTATIAITIIAH